MDAVPINNVINVLTQSETCKKIGHNKCTEAAPIFTCDLIQAMDKNRLPSRPMRTLWREQNVAGMSLDQYHTVDMLNLCKGQGDKGIIQDNISEGEYQGYIERNKHLHCMYIMITSQQTKDELQSE